MCIFATMKARFEHLGFYQEYYMVDKYIGIRPMPATFEASYGTGYQSRLDHIARQDFKVGKRWIRKGEKYWTMVIPSCGKMIKS